MLLLHCLNIFKLSLVAGFEIEAVVVKEEGITHPTSALEVTSQFKVQEICRNCKEKHIDRT